MIIRLRLATRRPSVAPDAFAATWPRAVAAVEAAPADARPVRVTVSTTIPELTGPAPRHDGISVGWFADGAHLDRFEAWLATPGGEAAQAAARLVVDPAASPVLVADEVVVRGAGWLEQRWHDGGRKLKHLGLAVRAAGLTPAELSDRWRTHAGRAGGTVIPDDARGLAYVQDHPRPRVAGDWAYDAISEVWFDDEEGLRRRIDWFRENLPSGGDALFRQSWFLAAREDVVLP